MQRNKREEGRGTIGGRKKRREKEERKGGSGRLKSA